MSNKKTDDQEAALETDALEVARFDLSQPISDFRAVMNEILPEGTPVKAEELVNREITVRYMRKFTGQYGPALYCIVTDANGELMNTVFGGEVLAPKLWAARDYLPFQLTLVYREQGQNDGYYDYKHPDEE